MSRAVVRESHARSFADVLLADAHSPELRVKNLSRTEKGLAILKEEARQEGLNVGFAQGLEQGRSEGFEQGRNEFELAHAEQLALFQSNLHSIEGQILETVQGWLNASEDKLAELATLIATRIIGLELQTDSEAILKISRTVLKEVTHADRAVVRVNPFDQELLAARQQELLSAVPALKHLQITADPIVGLGCVVETDGGVIDGTVETQIGSALKAIRGEAA
ncbi:MAG TPA: FliH/SctL family protein [Fimbriimonadaceae bacterium]|nr:FliH/SctL family protein [Fimbriimonadaceae bacterium]